MPQYTHLLNRKLFLSFPSIIHSVLLILSPECFSICPFLSSWLKPDSLLPVPRRLSYVPGHHLTTHILNQTLSSLFFNCAYPSLKGTAGHSTCWRINGGPVKYDYIQYAVSTLWNLFYPLSSFRSNGSALIKIYFSNLKSIRDVINSNNLLC